MQDLDIMKALRTCATCECDSCARGYYGCIELHELAANCLENAHADLESFHIALAVLRNECNSAKGITKSILTTALKLFPDGSTLSIPVPSKERSGYDYQLCPDYDSLSACLKELSCLGYPLLAVSQWEMTYTIFFRRPLP